MFHLSSNPEILVELHILFSTDKMAYSTLKKRSGTKAASSISEVLPSSSTVIQRFNQLSIEYGHMDLSLAQPGKKVVYLYNPGSLHACLNQVKSELVSSIDVTKQKMAAVKEIFHDMPDSFSKIEKAISRGNILDGKYANQCALEIGYASEVCLEHTKYCVKNFKNVRLLIAEMRELCTVKSLSLKKEINQFVIERKSLEPILSSKINEKKGHQSSLNLAKKMLEAQEKEAEKAAMINTAAQVGGSILGVATLITATVLTGPFGPLIAAPVFGGAAIAMKVTSDDLKVARRNLESVKGALEECESKVREIENQIDRLNSELRELENYKRKLSSLSEFLNKSNLECAEVMSWWTQAESFFQEVATRVAEKNYTRIRVFLSTIVGMVGKAMGFSNTRYLLSKIKFIKDDLAETQSRLK